jgi:hypothetical protein
MKMKAVQFIVLALALGVSSAQAHHSSAMVDVSKTITLNGTVSEWRFTNPHSWLYLAVIDASGKEAIWKLEGGSTSHMARNGWTFKTLKKGDKVVVTANPRSDGETSGIFKSVQMADGSTLGTMPRI